MRKRLEYHSIERIKDLCDDTIGCQYSGKATMLVEKLLNYAPPILEKVHLPHLIMCCVIFSVAFNDDPSVQLQHLHSVFRQALGLDLAFDYENN